MVNDIREVQRELGKFRDKISKIISPELLRDLERIQGRIVNLDVEARKSEIESGKLERELKEAKKSSTQGGNTSSDEKPKSGGFW